MTSEQYGAAYTKNFSITIRFLISRGISSDAAQESAQAAWVKGWECLGQLRDPNMICTWMNSIALNLHRSFIRKDRLEGEDRMPQLITIAENPTATIDAEKILNRCQYWDKIVLKQHYLQGYHVKEIADLNGWTETATRIRLLRARRKAFKISETRPLPGMKKPISPNRRRDAFMLDNQETSATVNAQNSRISLGAPINGQAGETERPTKTDIIIACMKTHGIKVPASVLRSAIAVHYPDWDCNSNRLNSMKAYVKAKFSKQELSGTVLQPQPTDKTFADERSLSEELSALQKYFDQGLKMLGNLAEKVHNLESGHAALLISVSSIRESVAKLGK